MAAATAVCVHVCSRVRVRVRAGVYACVRMRVRVRACVCMRDVFAIYDNIFNPG